MEIGLEVLVGHEVGEAESMRVRNVLRVDLAGKVKAIHTLSRFNLALDEVMVESQ